MLLGAAGVNALLIVGGGWTLFQVVEKVASAASLEAKGVADAAKIEANSASGAAKAAGENARGLGVEIGQQREKFMSTKREIDGLADGLKEMKKQLSGLDPNDIAKMADFYNAGKTEAIQKMSALIATEAFMAHAAAAGLAVPIGTICAWPGDLPTRETPWWEHWRPCWGKNSPGAKLLVKDNRELAAILGPYGNTGLNDDDEIKLPDFRGYFLRGLDTTGKQDPGQPKREGGGVDKIGSRQAQATALPDAGFNTDDGGSHFHEMVFSHGNVSKNSDNKYSDLENRANGLRATTEPAGNHSHRVIGGDEETRPKNYAVHWVIRIK